LLHVEWIVFDREGVCELPWFEEDGTFPNKE
jgi:hypothetical protein